MAMSTEFLLRLKLSAILFLLLPLLAFFHTRTLVDHRLPLALDDLQSVISALRGSGYRVFANSLEMVDIQSLLLSSEESYTLFAPPDEALYDIRFNCKSLQDYMDAVKNHIVNVKLSYRNLRRLPQGALLDTLMPNGRVIVTTTAQDKDVEQDAVMRVNNVPVSFPDLYYDNRFAVHGVTAAVDVLLAVASWKDPEAMATASWDPSESLRNILKSRPLNVCSDVFQNVSVILTYCSPIPYPHLHQ